MSKQTLYNEDLAPTPPEKRTWGGVHFFSLWVGMAVCIPTYMLAATLINGGMSWWQATLTILVGNTIVLLPMILNGYVGAKYGIPYPVYARASFGVKGANIPALLRAIVACGWFGIQSWIGGGAIYTCLLILWPDAQSVPPLLPAFLGVSLIPFLCFLIFWAINMFVIWRGTESIKFLETACSPFLLACGLALLAWAYVRAEGFGAMLSAASQFSNSSEFWKFFFPSLTAMVGFWATLSLNISDFTRYAKDQRSQLMGQAIGLPLTMTLFAFVGVAVTSATVVIFGEAIWDPVVLVRKFESPLLVFVSMIAVMIATLSTNVAANVVGPANDFSNLAPTKIDFRRGGYLTGIIGILIMPWKLLSDPTGYVFTWLVGYSALLGPVAGILLTDFYLLRRTRLNVDALYEENGPYAYRRGFNPVAILSLFLGILPNLPGFLVQIGVLSNTGIFALLSPLYHYAWFIGLGVSSIVYYVLMAKQTATHLNSGLSMAGT